MKQARSANVLTVLICTLLLCSCATTKPPLLKDLQEQGIDIRGQAKLPDQVIVYRETDVAGFTVEYGVLRLKGSNVNNLVLEYVDPEKKLVLGPKDILVYFKADVFNPTGMPLLVTHEVIFNDELNLREYDGGNAPHTTFYFYVRIPRSGEEIKSKILVQLQNSESFVETIELICQFKQQEQERGGGD